MIRPATLFGALSLVGVASAHIGAWHKGMYCLNGNSAGTDLNSYAIVSPLYQLPFSQWWMHASNNCNQYPPADGDYLDIPAGGSFQIELASNRAKTTLSYGGSGTSDWPDGQTYPEDYNVPSCITSPNLHAQNQSRAAGTAFAISYQSDINKVTPDNLVVFSVRYNTPWKRVVYYDVPAAMPPCPAGGCICAWGWVPNGCGEPNMFQTPFKCSVSGSTSSVPLAAPKPPVWCEGNPGACTKGAKQMIYWNQNEGNNIAVDGYDLEGDHKSPGYNSKLGFNDGAQNDIFSSAAPAPAPKPQPNASSPPASAPNPAPTPASAAATPPPPDSPAATTTAPAQNSSTAASTAAASGSGPNHAPSCSAGSKRRRRELASPVADGGADAESDTSLVRGSAVHAGVMAHKRHSARRGF
ncbi:hypothetical protein BJ912DRAFT_1047362 [Pholiota molesta]|nr:hypothetical protein BJ912DRAFT_1047362 [Pholiota molesta]